MENERVPGNRVKLSERNFKALIDYLLRLDDIRDNPTSTDQAVNGLIIDQYGIIEDIFKDIPAVRLSAAGLSLGALTNIDIKKIVIENLENEALLEGESLNSINNLSQQIDFMRYRYQGNDPEFNRFLANHYHNLPGNIEQVEELFLTTLSIFWSASRSEEFRQDITAEIGRHFGIIQQ
jgi:hypothetical protein